MEVRQYLRSKGFEWTEKTRPSGINAVMNCPFCQDKDHKFAINITTGAWKCNHENSCGLSGSWFDFQRRLGDEPKRLASDNDVYMPAKRTYKKPVVKITPAANKHLRFLKDRGFSDKVIKDFSIGQSNRAIMFPYYKDGEVVNIKYRSISEKKMWSEKDTEPVLFNRDKIKTNELLITEGELDCMAIAEYGFPAVSIPNGVNDFRWVDNEWDWLKKFKTIYLCYDNDNAGIKGEAEAVRRLGAWRCKGVKLPYKDANECLKRKIKKQEIYDCIMLAKNFPPANLVSTEYFTDDVVELIANPRLLHGTPTAWEKLTEYLKGWRMEELTVWSGRNGSGKSTILNQHILSLADRGIKSCIASLEMSPARYLRWAVLQHTGRKYPEENMVREALHWMNEKIYIMNTAEAAKPDDIFSIFEYAARRYDVKHFVIDSLMRVNFPGKEELKEHKNFVSEVVSFCKKFKVHVHLVAHPRKSMKDGDKPGKVDIMGTSNISDLAHNVLIVWRPDEEQKESAAKQGKIMPDAVLYVKKNREFGTEGGIKLFFDRETKLFSENSYEKTT